MVPSFTQGKKFGSARPEGREKRAEVKRREEREREAGEHGIGHETRSQAPAGRDQLQRGLAVAGERVLDGLVIQVANGAVCVRRVGGVRWQTLTSVMPISSSESSATGTIRCRIGRPRACPPEAPTSPNFNHIADGTNAKWVARTELQGKNYEDCRRSASLCRKRAACRRCLGLSAEGSCCVRPR